MTLREVTERVTAKLLTRPSATAGRLGTRPVRGFPAGRGWADINGDGKTDFCRRVGGGANGERVSCTPSTGGTFGNSHVSGVIDWGLVN